jgi:hypothetical protein
LPIKANVVLKKKVILVQLGMLNVLYVPGIWKDDRNIIKSDLKIMNNVNINIKLLSCTKKLLLFYTN